MSDSNLPPPSALPPPSSLPPPSALPLPGAAKVPVPDAAKISPPPPELPKYVPPVPSDPPISRPGVPDPAEARRANLKVQAPAEEESTENGAAAPFNTRMAAAGIDLVVMVGVLTLLCVLLPAVLRPATLGWLLGAAYLVVRDSLPFLGGQSVGKKAVGIRVQTQAGGKPITGNWNAGLARNAALLIPFFVFVEIYILLTRDDTPRRGIRLGDEWARTKVVFHRLPPAEEEPVQEEA